MANKTAAFGFVPAYSLLGEIREIECAALTAASDLFVGDPVKLSGTGDSSGRPSITVAAATNENIFGVVVGIRATGPDELFKQYSDSADTVIVVPTLPGMIFMVNTNSTGLALDDIGLRFDHVAASGDTLTGRSAYLLDVDGTPAGSVSSNQWALIGFDDRTDNVFSSTVSTVTLNTHGLVYCSESFWHTGGNGA